VGIGDGTAPPRRWHLLLHSPLSSGGRSHFSAVPFARRGAPSLVGTTHAYSDYDRSTCLLVCGGLADEESSCRVKSSLHIFLVANLIPGRGAPTSAQPRQCLLLFVLPLRLSARRNKRTQRRSCQESNLGAATLSSNVQGPPPLQNPLSPIHNRGYCQLPISLRIAN